MQLNQNKQIAQPSAPTRHHLPAFIGMIALADFLIFRQSPGLNLFILSVAVAITITLAVPRHAQPSIALHHLLLVMLVAMPLLEAPSVTGLILVVTALIFVALASARLLPKKPSSIPFVLLRFIPLMPIRLMKDVRLYFASHSGKNVLGTTLGSVAGWVFPLTMGLVFLLLFSMANPLIEMGLANIDLHFLLKFLDIGRFGFWLVIAMMIWALLHPRLMRRSRRRIFTNTTSDHQVSAFLDHRGLLRCLWVFNLLFAVQTLLDLMYLWGGADLPAGMSHAQYAHRGAYPLIATALLAAFFVLVAMRRSGPGDKSPLIRLLVIAWIIQNILLCLSSILRLDLYVEAYSLTGWRIAAGIWMGLVAAGLLFILLRIIQERSNAWLVSVNLTTLAAVLYLSAGFDFSAFVARYNVEHSLEIAGEGVPLDLGYLKSLGPSTIPELDRYMSAVPEDSIKRQVAQRIRDRLASNVENASSDWRSWSFRTHRLKNYLQSGSLIER